MNDAPLAIVDLIAAAEAVEDALGQAVQGEIELIGRLGLDQLAEVRELPNEIVLALREDRLEAAANAAQVLVLRLENWVVDEVGVMRKARHLDDEINYRREIIEG